MKAVHAKSIKNTLSKANRKCSERPVPIAVWPSGLGQLYGSRESLQEQLGLKKQKDQKTPPKCTANTMEDCVTVKGPSSMRYNCARTNTTAQVRI